MDGLSVRERSLLYGLIRWPSLSDAGLGEVLGVGRSTVTAVRRRLSGGGFFAERLVPDFRRAGCELLTALYGEFSGRAESLVEEGVKDLSSMFYMLSSRRHHLGFGAAQNITSVRESIAQHHRIHHDSGYLTNKRHNYVFFPLKLSRIHRFFDYAPLIADSFGLEHKTEKENINTREWSPGKKEYRVFRCLVADPTGTDEEVAKASGVSRQSVNVLRNRFLREGLLKQVRIPDLARLGYDLVAFTHIHLNPQSSLIDRERRSKMVLSDPSIVLKVAGDLETVMLSAHKDYADYRRSHERVMGVYGEELLSDDPITCLYPLADSIHVLDHEYVNALE